MLKAQRIVEEGTPEQGSLFGEDPPVDQGFIMAEAEDRIKLLTQHTEPEVMQFTADDDVIIKDSGKC